MKVEMFEYLRSQYVNLQLLQESACSELIIQLERISGSKVIVLEKAMMGPIGLITTSNFFSERDIKLMKLQPNVIYQRDVINIIYIVRSQFEQIDLIAEQVQKNAERGRLFHIFFVPRRSSFCIKQLENKGVYSSFGQLEELSWNFFPLDADIVTMEMPHVFRDTAVDGDTGALYQAAIGLVQLQCLYGRIPKIYGKGVHAQCVWDHAKRLAAEQKTLFNGDKGAIDQLILLDRSIDLLSPLATQLTYEGLIDEFFGILQNQLSLPVDLFATSTRADDTIGNSSQATNPVSIAEHKTFVLNSGQQLYAQLRNKNFNEVGHVLTRNARDLSVQMNTCVQDKSVQDMKRLVDKLPILLAQKQAVAVHTTIAEIIHKRVDSYEFTEDLAAEQEFMVCSDIDKPSAYIENHIARKSDLKNVLRLICIQCAAASGFKEKILNYYKRELAHVYGLKVLLTISNLEKAGMLHLQSESRAYAVLRKTLNLTVDDMVEVGPKDISYVHSFYAPLTARLVEQSLKPLGWQSLKSQINNLPGPTFEDFQAQLIGIGGRHTTSTPSEGNSLNIPRVIMVFFVGGCTFAEIAALRFLAQQEDNNVEFVIATTKVINKHTFIESLM